MGADAGLHAPGARWRFRHGLLTSEKTSLQWQDSSCRAREISSKINDLGDKFPRHFFSALQLKKCGPDARVVASALRRGIVRGPRAMYSSEQTSFDDCPKIRTCVPP